MFCLEQKHTLTTELQGDSGTSVTRACLAPVCTCRKKWPIKGKDPNIFCHKHKAKTTFFVQRFFSIVMNLQFIKMVSFGIIGIGVSFHWDRPDWQK